MIVTPEFLDEFRKDFDEAVEGLREKYDISINLGSITYELERFSATLSVNMTRDPDSRRFCGAARLSFLSSHP